MKNLKLSLIAVLAVSFASLHCMASLDCEDAQQFSSDSTELSRQVFQYEQHKNEDGSEALAVRLADQMVQEIDQSLSINNQDESSEYLAVKKMLSSNQNFFSTAKALKQDKLQFLNHLRMEQMKVMRTQYAHCFSKN